MSGDEYDRATRSETRARGQRLCLLTVRLWDPRTLPDCEPTQGGRKSELERSKDTVGLLEDFVRCDEVRFNPASCFRKAWVGCLSRLRDRPGMRHVQLCIESAECQGINLGSCTGRARHT